MSGQFEDTILQILSEACKQMGTQSALAKAAGVSNANLSRWLNGVQSPKLSEITKVLDFLNASVRGPNHKEIDYPVKFIDAKISPAGEGVAPPEAENYIAAPMVGEVGAGPGYVPQEEVKSWFLVYRDLPAVRLRRNLLAVEIGPRSTSMQPTLNPGDIVLVDRDDRDVSSPGHMMLVKDPEGEGMIKRVALENRPNKDVRITYYSDNASQFPPLVYSLKKDFEGDWEKCIVGRVIWAWTDVREK